MSQEDRKIRKLVKKVIKQHRKGKSIEDIIDDMHLDPYTANAVAFEVGMEMEKRRNR